MTTAEICAGQLDAIQPNEETNLPLLKPNTLGLYITTEIYKHGALSLMELQDEIQEIVGHLPSEGALYGTASRLKSDGLIVSEKSEVMVKKHKIKLRVYKITEKGKAVLNKTRDAMEQQLSYLNSLESHLDNCPA